MFDSQIEELEETNDEFKLNSSRKSDYLYPLPTNLTNSQLNNRKKLPISLRIGAIVLLGTLYLMMFASLFNYTRNGLLNSIAQNNYQKKQSIATFRQPIKKHS